MLDALRELLGVLAALLVVSVLAWAAIALMKRFQLQGPGGASVDDLRFLRALPLGPRERLVVVEWRGETLLLGVTAGGVTLIERRGAPTGVGVDPS